MEAELFADAECMECVDIGSAQPGLEGGAPRLPPQRAVTLGEERTETMGADHGEQVRMHVRPHQFGYGFSETVYTRRTRVDVSYSGYSRYTAN